MEILCFNIQIVTEVFSYRVNIQESMKNDDYRRILRLSDIEMKYKVRVDFVG